MGLQSRAALLLQRELYKIEHSVSNPWGISIDLYRNNLFQWICSIEGLQGSVFEGGTFQVMIQFSQEYDEIQPDVCFTTIPFHPNINLITGKPCIDYLDDSNQWECGYSIVSLLLQLQVLLEFPVLENSVNLAAQDLYMNSPKLYEQMARDSVIASRRIKAGLTIFEEAPKVEIPVEEEAIPIKTVKKKMSFESYYNDWKSIATSVAAEKPVALESTFQKPKNLYYFDRKQLKTDEMQRIMQTYQDLYFGKMPSKKFIKSRKDALDKQNAKLNQHVSRAVEISQSQSKSVVEETQRLLQKISDKLPDKSQSSESRKSSYLTTDEDDSDSEWEKEADGLLDWSEGLESAQQF